MLTIISPNCIVEMGRIGGIIQFQERNTTVIPGTIINPKIQFKTERDLITVFEHVDELIVRKIYEKICNELFGNKVMRINENGNMTLECKRHE